MWHRSKARNSRERASRARSISAVRSQPEAGPRPSRRQLGVAVALVVTALARTNPAEGRDGGRMAYGILDNDGGVCGARLLFGLPFDKRSGRWANALSWRR